MSQIKTNSGDALLFTANFVFCISPGECKADSVYVPFETIPAHKDNAHSAFNYFICFGMFCKWSWYIQKIEWERHKIKKESTKRKSQKTKPKTESLRPLLRPQSPKKAIFWLLLIIVKFYFKMINEIVYCVVFVWFVAGCGKSGDKEKSPKREEVSRRRRVRWKNEWIAKWSCVGKCSIMFPV